MSPILQCYPQMQSAIVAQAGVYSDAAKAGRSFFTRLTKDEMPLEYGEKKPQKRTRNYKTVELENKIIESIFGEKCTPYKVAGLLKIDESKTKKVMARLFEEGRLHRIDSGRILTRGRTHFYRKTDEPKGSMCQSYQAVYESIEENGSTVYAIHVKTGRNERTLKAALEAMVKIGFILKSEKLIRGKIRFIYTRSGEK